MRNPLVEIILRRIAGDFHRTRAARVQMQGVPRANKRGGPTAGFHLSLSVERRDPTAGGRYVHAKTPVARHIQIQIGGGDRHGILAL
jgi:hypothetical protein